VQQNSIDDPEHHSDAADTQCNREYRDSCVPTVFGENTPTKA
jgi:hypothetical protein